MSSLGLFYEKLYGILCGQHPNQYPWHFQWLAAYVLHRDMRGVLNSLGGDVLDVGCGSKPYEKWFGKREKYVGLDVAAGPKVDLLVTTESNSWPLESDQFDTVMCTQVAEHVKNIEIMQELLRVAKPGGTLVVSIPFIYNEHGAPHDYRRYSVHGVIDLFSSMGWEILDIKKQGGIGSTIGILLLNWLNAELNSNKITRILKGLFLPILIFLSALINFLALFWDQVDNTGAFYNNVLLVARKPCA